MSPESEQIFDKEVERIEKVVGQLMEHFDTVQVFATRHDTSDKAVGGTLSFNVGRGNWYARMGHIREWIIKEDARVAAQTHREVNEEDDD